MKKSIVGKSVILTAVLMGVLVAFCYAEESGENKNAQKTDKKKVVNLVPNGDMEKWTEKGLPEGWRVYKAKDSQGNVAKETTEIHSGKAGVRMEVGPEGKGFFIGTQFKNVPEKKYRLTFYWKSPVGFIQYAVKRVIPKRGWVAYNGKKWVLVNANLNHKAKKDEWNKTELVFDAFEEELKMSLEICRPAGRGKDYTFFVDDVVLEEIKESDETAE